MDAFSLLTVCCIFGTRDAVAGLVSVMDTAGGTERCTKLTSTFQSVCWSRLALLLASYMAHNLVPLEASPVECSQWYSGHCSDDRRDAPCSPARVPQVAYDAARHILSPDLQQKPEGWTRQGDTSFHVTRTRMSQRLNHGCTAHDGHDNHVTICLPHVFHLRPNENASEHQNMTTEHCSPTFYHTGRGSDQWQRHTPGCLPRGGVTAFTQRRVDVTQQRAHLKECHVLTDSPRQVKYRAATRS